jgi:hypothetical protein
LHADPLAAWLSEGMADKHQRICNRSYAESDTFVRDYRAHMMLAWLNTNIWTLQLPAHHLLGLAVSFSMLSTQFKLCEHVCTGGSNSGTAAAQHSPGQSNSKSSSYSSSKSSSYGSSMSLVIFNVSTAVLATQYTRHPSPPKNYVAACRVTLPLLCMFELLASCLACRNIPVLG